MTEPTPACVTTTRARRIVSTMLLEREEVDELARPARSIARRVAVLDDELLVERQLRDRAQQPVEAGLVRADADEDHAPAEKTLPAKRAPRQRVGELRPLHVAARCDRRDQPVGERRAFDPREALDVDDLRAAQPRDPGERHGDARAGREHDLRPHLADDAPRDDEVAEQVLDAAVRRPVGEVDALVARAASGRRSCRTSPRRA